VLVDDVVKVEVDVRVVDVPEVVVVDVVVESVFDVLVLLVLERDVVVDVSVVLVCEVLD